MLIILQKKNEPNFYAQRSKLNKQRETVAKEKDKYDKELRSVNSNINTYEFRRNTYTNNIKISIKRIISSIEAYYSHQISLNNTSLMNRISEKRRLAKQEKILEQENFYLPTLKELEENIKRYIDKRQDENIFKLNLKEELIAFLKNTYSKELSELLEAIQTYYEKYAELKENLDEATQKKEEIEEKLKKIKSTIASIDEYIKQIDGYYRNDPISEFMDKIEFKYEEACAKPRR